MAAMLISGLLSFFAPIHYAGAHQPVTLSPDAARAVKTGENSTK
jgi:hypothetical protein